ncbi:DinB family protein [Bacillus sp. FSL K6-3431]|uniref:DinB family protein n=1 Tax=Bacillus sp. FSL K6-3431 TaxID=2921500 RepID=UPI0030F68E2F
MIHPTIKMYDYHVWANGVIIDRLKELPEDIYHRDIQSGFSSVSKVLSHIYLVDSGWFDIVVGKSMNKAFESAEQKREEMEAKSVKEMEVSFSELSGRYKELLTSGMDTEKMIIVNNPYAGLLETSFSESILHIVTHGSYHRGNIATMLRQMGQTSVMQDYGLYLYKA